MEIRGERECRECGARWSYYETGSVDCPACGSLRSVGVGERREHTATTATLDLTEVRNLIDERPLRDVAREAKTATRKYVHRVGFVDAGELRPLDETYLAARELLNAADLVARGLDLGDDAELYFLSLLRGADGGERPAAADAPASMAEARGLASANAVDAYREELLELAGDDPAVREAAGRLDDHVRRVRALEGEVEPAEADRLVEAARDVGRYVRDGDETALATARDRLSRLG